jgi:ribosomal protein S18 acetylase RimI-like enzyme
LASLLIEKAQLLSQETEASGLLLETVKSNLPANQLYPQLGFERDDHYYFWETPTALL